MRIFINNVDTYSGNAYCADLRRFGGVSHRLFGTIKGDQNGVIPSCIRRIVSRSNNKIYLDTLLSCSLVVFDLQNSDLGEIEYVIRVLNEAPLEKEITFVLVSSALVWNKTIKRYEQLKTIDEETLKSLKGIRVVQPEHLAQLKITIKEAKETKSQMDEGVDSENKEEKEGKDVNQEESELSDGEDEEEEDENEEEEASKEESEKEEKGNDAEGEDENMKILVPFIDKDYPKRLCTNEFNKWKLLESLALALNTKENIQAYVIAPGIMYGNGEYILEDIFYNCWKSNPEVLRIFDEGTNYLPLVHVRDCARLVRIVSQQSKSTEGEKYLLCVDESHHTQRELIEGIIKGMSKPLKDIPTASFEESIASPLANILLLDLILKPTSLMTDESFTWWCKKGILSNFQKVSKEYVNYRKLRPIKICVTGPPAVGCTTIAQLIAKKYNVECLSIRKMIEKAENRGDELSAKLQEYRLSQNATSQETTKGAPSKGGKALAVQKQIRYPTKLLAEIVKSCLNENPQKYKGYVLDGFPRTYEDAKLTYEKKKKKVSEDGEEKQEEGSENENEESLEKEEGEEVEEDKIDSDPLNPIIDEEATEYDNIIGPDHVIYLNASEDYCIKNVHARASSRQLTKNTVPKSENFVQKDTLLNDLENHDESRDSEIGFANRWNKYMGNLSSGKYVLEYITSKGVVDYLVLNPEEREVDDMMQLIHIYVTRNGSFNNFLPTELELLEEAHKKQSEEAKEKAQQECEELSKRIEVEKEYIRARNEKDKERLALINEHEQELLEVQSVPLKTYLLEYVMPTLTEGLIETSRANPEDPIDFLAEFLFRKSQELEGDLHPSSFVYQQTKINNTNEHNVSNSNV